LQGGRDSDAGAYADVLPERHHNIAVKSDYARIHNINGLLLDVLYPPEEECADA
jgi:hypothetical protein